MADNVAITPGSGTTVSTEEVTTLNGGAVAPQHLQRIAGAIRTADGAAIDLPGDAVSGLDVDVTRIGGVAPAFGSGAAGPAVLRTVSAADDPIVTAINSGVSASLPAGTQPIGHVGGVDYRTVAASQTDHILGSTGAQHDYLAGLLVVPATTSPGAVSIKDASGTAITVFAGGSLSNLVPFVIPIGAKCTGSTSPGWKVTTGANVSLLAVGDFT